MSEDIVERSERAKEENDETEAQRQARELSKAQEGSAHIREEGVTAADKLDEGDLSESDEEALRGS